MGQNVWLLIYHACLLQLADQWWKSWTQIYDANLKYYLYSNPFKTCIEKNHSFAGVHTPNFHECLKVPRNPTNFAFIWVGLILDKKHYFEK